MTLILDHASPGVEEPTAEQPAPSPAPTAPADEPRPPLGPRRTAAVVAAWVGVTLIGVVLVLVGVSPLTAQRDQRRLLTEARSDIHQAANEAFGLPGASVATTAPSVGDPVAILDIGELRLRQVVVEGAEANQTAQGPGHVVGTAGPGQPGNSVIVGRRSLSGAPFGELGSLAEGDRIVVSTVQGQSLYVVSSVRERRLTGPSSVEQVEGPSDDDRLTLITSAAGSPTDDERATVVVAKMDGLPFAPTPQGGRTPEGDGRHGASGISAGLVLALLGYAAAVAGAVVAYRRLPWRSAYLLSAPVLVALTVVLAEQVGRMLPAWA